MARWLLLTHQLPSEPSKIRVKVWKKLQFLGAVPIKNSVYVLPNRTGTREDFEWLRKDIVRMKGEASVFLADSVTGTDDKDIIKAFQETRAKDFDLFIHTSQDLVDSLLSALQGGHLDKRRLDQLEKAWTAQKAEWERLEKIDFFDAPNRRTAGALVIRAQNLFQGAKALSSKENPEPPHPLEKGNLKQRLWVTRASPHIDRLACAWLIRRFIDPPARFKFVTEPYRPKSSREIRFDMAEGEFTHFGGWCSFETFLHRLNLKDPALGAMGEIVHDIDLKDKKFNRLEASGISHAIRGLCRLHKGDLKRLEAGIEFFDAIYAAIEEKP